ncbi:hypothetical protein IGS59_22710 [Janthinobacterium sp. GW460P]|uniref:hypothetical protein n=1 Tax=unclassified Janthinobacterium TaxID=2610881 RepID=UPI001482580D|nr:MULTISPECIES: hypothetical protein [unclassified Janthinobacterium]MCC7705059.1 hypothetical protein [Janthinobacterium sp. GW460P]MCC7710561.1 hypothetical protein [Janthinobacterium sp. GW460W]
MGVFLWKDNIASIIRSTLAIIKAKILSQIQQNSAFIALGGGDSALPASETRRARV